MISRKTIRLLKNDKRMSCLFNRRGTIYCIHLIPFLFMDRTYKKRVVNASDRRERSNLHAYINGVCVRMEGPSDRHPDASVNASIASGYRFASFLTHTPNESVIARNPDIRCRDDEAISMHRSRFYIGEQDGHDKSCPYIKYNRGASVKLGILYQGLIFQMPLRICNEIASAFGLAMRIFRLPCRLWSLATARKL